MAEKVFTSERDLALKTGRCMGCDEKMMQRPTKKGHKPKPAVICGRPDCVAYYYKLWSIERRPTTTTGRLRSAATTKARVPKRTRKATKS